MNVMKAMGLTPVGGSETFSECFDLRTLLYYLLFIQVTWPIHLSFRESRFRFIFLSWGKRLKTKKWRVGFSWMSLQKLLQQALVLKMGHGRFNDLYNPHWGRNVENASFLWDGWVGGFSCWK